MKLKLKVEPKDLVIFCIFSFFWFIVVQLLVVNVNAFVQEESFTVNIFLVFTNGIMFMMTIALFLLGIIIGLISVKSYIFDRGTGFGIEVGAKKEKNYSRWAKDKEMKAELKKVNPKILVLGEYINTDTKILVKCIVCGETWKTRPDHLLKGHGCPTCAAREAADKSRKTN